MKQNWQLRPQKQLYQVIQDTQMSFLLLSSGMQMALSMEAFEKKVAHRDLLMGLRWSWITRTFLDTIGYLAITGAGGGRQRAQPLSEPKDQLMALTPSWVNTPGSRGAGGGVPGGHPRVCAAGKWICG